VELAVTSRMSGSERSRSAVLLRLSCGMTTDVFRYRTAWDVSVWQLMKRNSGSRSPAGQHWITGWVRFRVPDAPEGRSVNVVLLSILYAVLATSFARSENILSTPAYDARSHGFNASTFAVVRLEDLHEIAHIKNRPHRCLSARPLLGTVRPSHGSRQSRTR
jgi:hypothetical protein